jgi:Leucine-rich repeat (LRR) protein
VPSGISDTTVTLDIAYNNISDLTAASFANKGMNQLTSLFIYNNAISNIDSEAFRSLPNLKSLFMGLNKLTYIHRDTFAHNTKLEELDLHGNNIRTGDEWPFHNLVSLCVLNLADCNLTNIPKGAFQKTVNLISLDVSSNKLTYIDDHLFGSLKSLKFLNLSANLLKSVDFLLVISTTTLHEIDLYLYNNRLDIVSDEVLQRMGHLKNLSIHENSFLCSCWDRNCSKYIKDIETPVGSCLNKTTTAPLRKLTVVITNTDIEPTEISVNEGSILQERDTRRPTSSVLISDPDFTNVGTTDVKDLTTEQQSSPEPSAAGVDMNLLVSLAVIIPVTAVVIFVCCWIRKKRKSLSVECGSVLHEQQNWQQQQQQQQQQRPCDVCPIYANYTPNCDHKVSRQNTSRRKKGELNFATQLTLETYETGEVTEECCLYIPTQDEQLTQHIYSNDDSGHSGPS